MKNEKVSIRLREYAKNELTPTVEQRSRVTAVYAAICSVLGERNCWQIGSYPRFTAIRPPHDLDVLFQVGTWPGFEPTTSSIMNDLKAKLERELTAPSGLSFKVVVQSHSVSISFHKGADEEFAVDIVPAWASGAKNEFGDDIYWVPEILIEGHRRRLAEYKRIAEFGGHIDFILTDPKGYISVAAALNKLNEDFRRSTKIVKKWKCIARELSEFFKLKSFHVEQILTIYFRQDPSIDVTEAVYRFFQELPDWISYSRIPDRANPERHIDAYINDLTATERAVILEARDQMLRRLKDYDGTEAADILFTTPARSAVTKATVRSASATSALRVEKQSVQPRAPFGAVE